MTKTLLSRLTASVCMISASLALMLSAPQAFNVLAAHSCDTAMSSDGGGSGEGGHGAGAGGDHSSAGESGEHSANGEAGEHSAPGIHSREHHADDDATETVEEDLELVDDASVKPEPVKPHDGLQHQRKSKILK